MTADVFLVDQYLEEVRSLATPLANEETLRSRARRGDKAATAELVRSYLSLAAELGLRLAPDRLTKLEAIQEANLVLMRVIADDESPALVLGPRIANHFAEMR